MTIQIPGRPASGGGGSASPVSSGLLPLSAMRYPRAKAVSVGAGNVTVHTAGAGRRAYINAFGVYNTTGGSITFYPNWVIGGTHYKLSNTLTVGTGAANQVATAVVIILEPGESFSVYASAAGLNIRARVIEYSSSVRLYAPKKYGSWASGDNTIYSVPTGYDAAILDGVGMLAQNVTSLNYFNGSGGSVTNKWNIVDSGGSPASSNQVSPSAALATDSRSSQVVSTTMEEGDFLNLNVNSTTDPQLGWAIVAETPNNV